MYYYNFGCPSLAVLEGKKLQMLGWFAAVIHLNFKSRWLALGTKTKGMIQQWLVLPNLRCM